MSRAQSCLAFFAVLLASGAACSSRVGVGEPKAGTLGADPARAVAARAADTAEVPEANARYSAHELASILLDVEPQVGFVAPLPDATRLDCDSLRVRSSFTGAHAVHVFVSGVPRLTAAQFGIRYPETMDVASWQTSSGAVEITSGDWPASGSWVAVAFGTGRSGDLPLVHLGTLTVAPGAKGILEIVGVSEDQDLVKVSDGKHLDWIVRPGRLSSVAIRADGGASAPCD